MIGLEGARAYRCLAAGRNTLVFGADAQVAEWVRARIGLENFGPCTAIGVARQGRLAAGVVYHNFYKHKDKAVAIEMSVAAEGKTWLNRKVLYELFAYPFLGLKVGRIQCTMAAEAENVIAFNKSLGFVYEGTCRRARFDGSDCVVTSMLKDECKWLALSPKQE